MWRAWVAAGVLLVSGCSSAPQVSVSLYQTRSDTPLNRMEIQVRNDGPEPVTVQRAELRSERLNGVAAWDEPVTVPAGTAMDLKVTLPEPTCTGGTDEVRLTVDGHEVVMPAEDALGQLDRYIEQRCFERAVAETAVLRIERVTHDGIAVFTSPGRATIGDLGTTILFAPVDPGAVTASPGEQPRTRRVVLRPNRCDAHALGEDKQGTYFDVGVTLPDGRTGSYRLGVDPAMRSQLYRLYARMCGLS